MDFSSKRIIVTGAASGIGLATARHIRDLGASVLGVDVKPCPDVDEFYEADLSDPNAVDTLIETLPSGADGLCNVAGVPPSAPAGVVLAINAKGLERLTVGLATKLAEEASIVNIASSAGSGWAESAEQLRAFDAVPFDLASLDTFAADNGLLGGGASYFFSKEFVITFTMRHRWTWRDRGIRINCISPGPVETPALPDFIETLGRAKRMMELMDRSGQPEEIAPVVAFLLSDDSDWIRGSNVAVDGGMTSHLAIERLGLD